MDREHGTERLADASFLEELLRGRRTLVLTCGDGAPGQHLAKRLGTGVALVEGARAAGRPDASIDAVVALGGFQDPDVDGLITEARRLLAPGGIFAVSWIDASRPSLEAKPGDAVAVRTTVLNPAEAARRLQAQFGQVAVVARQPYLGFQYVSGLDTGGALTLDSSLTLGGPEAPTGFLALASDSALALSDALIQVPYDRAVARVARWVRELPSPAAPAPAPASSPTRRTVAVAHARDGGDELERLRAEVTALRERAQGAVEEADRARGEVRSSKERAALLEAEVTKLRGRVRGIPEAEAERLRGEIGERTRERDAARRDAEGAGAEAARALEAAAILERDVEFMQSKIVELEHEAEEVRAARAKLDEEVAAKLAEARDQSRLARTELEKAKSEIVRLKEERAGIGEERDHARGEADRLAEELETAREAAHGAGAGAEALAEAATRTELANKRAKDFEERFKDATAKLAKATSLADDLNAAKVAAERSAADAWARLKAAPAAGESAATSAGDLVPASDLAASEKALAEAIARAEDAERARREAVEGGHTGSGAAAGADPAESDAVRAELAVQRKRAESAEARAETSARAAEDARARAEEAAKAVRGPADSEGLKSLLHQRESALAEARTLTQAAEARAARLSTDAAEALERLRVSEETLAERDSDLKRALGALTGVESREQRDQELIAELKGEVARLTESNVAGREELRQRIATSDTSVPVAAESSDPAGVVRERDEAIRSAAMAQAESARAHAESDARDEQLQAIAKEVEGLRAEKTKRDEQAAERERRISELEAKLMEARSAGDSSGDVERRASAMAERLTRLEAELERAHDDVKQATAEARKYRALAEAIEPPSR